jgi:outer membrane lipoprotein-sorting protein
MIKSEGYETKKSVSEPEGAKDDSGPLTSEEQSTPKPAPMTGSQPALSPKADPDAAKAAEQALKTQPGLPVAPEPPLQVQPPLSPEAAPSADPTAVSAPERAALKTLPVAPVEPEQPALSPEAVPSEDPTAVSTPQQALKTSPAPPPGNPAHPFRRPASSPDSGGFTEASALLVDDKDISKILEKADEARGNLKGVQWVVSVAVSDHQKNDKIVYDVKARAFDTLAESLYPSKDKGNKILMVNGNMWFYKPGLSKPVPIARRQKLLGTAAYGDIASTNYDEDYEADPLPDDRVDGESCYVFSLKAKTSKATYDRIKYWIRKRDVVGVKAEYFTVSGKKFKSATMEYQNSVMVDGNARPFISKIDIRDELMVNGQTILSFTDTQIGRIPDYVFNINLLRR